MKKLLISIATTLLSIVTFAQAPQSFQYQAVVRDVNGVALQNQSVGFQLSIISGSPTGTVEYVETHSATTNGFGIVTLAVGSGTVVSGTFALISWGTSTYYLKVETDLGSGYVNMGTTQLLSVPYSLNSAKSDNATNADYATVAGNVQTYTAGSGISIIGNVVTNTQPDQTVALTGNGATSVTGTYPNFTISSTDNNSGTPAGVNKSLQFNNGGAFDGNSNLIWDNSNERLGVGISNPLGRVVVQGSPTALPSEPLFEVKNSIGQSVFVVWQDSVQVFINDDNIMSNRGGFAVSGRSLAKAFTNHYLKVTPDSSRIWTKDTIMGFGVKNINGTNKTSYMQLNPDNYFIGHQAGNSITTGKYNSFIGYQSGYNNTIGNKNYFIGYRSGYSNNSGFSNVFIGDSTGFANNFGNYNVNIGNGSNQSNIFGNYSVSIGYQSLLNNNESYNVAIGYQSLLTNTTGTFNVASGAYSLFSNVSGFGNVASGIQSLYSNTTGNNNVAYGSNALYDNLTGNLNTAIGTSAYIGGTAFSNSTAIGSNTTVTASNQVVLGNNSITSFYCQGAFAATTALAANMYVSASGQIMRSTSSKRYKKNIENIAINTEDIYKLRPVSYISIMDNKPYFGLIAEEVADVIPALAEFAKEKDVVKGSTSEKLIPDAVQYPMLSVLLLKEVQKHQITISELNNKINKLELENKLLNESINELKTQIQNIIKK